MSGANVPVPAIRVLILGGTAEAGALAAAAVARFGARARVISSLAGRTTDRAPLAGEVRVGGFGGVGGLAAYLSEHGIDAVIDATHPFAANISANARRASERAGVARLVLARPEWRREPGDRWIEVDDSAHAASLLPGLGRRAFLTVGARELGAFAPLRHMWFLVRLIEPPEGAPPLHSHRLILGRGPFTVVAERALLVEHAIDVLVSKASGGASTEAKIVAARELGLPVVVLRRPLPEPGERVESVEDALLWLALRLDSAKGARPERARSEDVAEPRP